MPNPSVFPASAPVIPSNAGIHILLLGKDGQLGRELQRSLAPLGTLTAWGRETADLSKPESLFDLVMAAKPNVIVNAAAYTAVDKAEAEPELAHAINAAAPAALAKAALALGCQLIHYSTDYVFDGSGTVPWTEDAPVSPQNVYGASKLAGEQTIAASGCKHLIFRTSWVYAKEGGNFAKTMLRLASERDALSVIDDQIGAPTDAGWLADMTAQVLAPIYAIGGVARIDGVVIVQPATPLSHSDISPTAVGATNTYRLSGQNSAPLKTAESSIKPTTVGMSCPYEIGEMSASADKGVVSEPVPKELNGIYHAACAGEVSWHGYASYLIAKARQMGFPVRVAEDALRAVPSSAFPTPARRPLNSRLDCTKLVQTFGIAPPSWQQGIEQLLQHLKP